MKDMFIYARNQIVWLEDMIKTGCSQQKLDFKISKGSVTLHLSNC